MISSTDIWKDFLKIIREEAGNHVVETWFKAVVLSEWNRSSSQVTLSMPNTFVKNWIQEHYLELTKAHLSRLLNCESLTIIFTVSTESTPHTNASPHTPSPSNAIIPARSLTQKKTSLPSPKLDLLAQKKKFSTGLNTLYQLDNFIVGPSNSLARAASYAVSQTLGTVYNPLFIYGGTGLGKTHLLHAIGNEVLQKDQKKRVCYETSDHFMNEFISAIRHDKIQHFRHKYTKIDLLLLDDVQFFSNKEQTQETFFHIFNVLYEQQKQIVLSSDTYPKEISGLQSRLRSRMGWGLVVDIQLPDLETKIAILKKKAETNRIDLNDDVAHYIASRIRSNIRDLEGSLTRVEAFSSLTNQKITVDLAQRVLLNVPKEEKKEEIVISKILTVVAKNYGVSIPDLKSKKRYKNVAVARQAAFYLIKKHSFSSLKTIGSAIGGRDHSTVIHAITKVENLKEHDVTFAQKLKHVEQEILCD